MSVVDKEGGMTAGAKLEPINNRAQVVTEGSPRVMKLVSLMLLTPQYAVLILLMRYVRTRPGPMFVTSTTVVLSEVTKTASCLLIILAQHKGSPKAWAGHLYEFLISRPRDFLKVCVPSLLFVLQNNLVFVAISNLDAATFQVTYQLKILTTAVFSVILLRKKLSCTQWLSLFLLFAGVSLIQVKQALGQAGMSSLSLGKILYLQNPFSSTSSSSSSLSPSSPSAASSPSASSRSLLAWNVSATLTPEASQALLPSPESSQNHFTGLMAVLACCCLSGFANVFFELLLKGGKQSVWMRNVQLGLSGIVLSIFTCLAHDGVTVQRKGFLYGYDELVWLVIGLQSVGGLLVAAVIKYADNILKGFSTAGSILLSCVASVYIFDFKMDSVFITGTTLVLSSVYLYNLFPAQQPESQTTTIRVYHQQQQQQQQPLIKPEPNNNIS